MGFRVDVRIHPQRDRRTLAQAAGDLGQPVQFGFGLDVEAVDAVGQRGAHFVARLADTGEHPILGLPARGLAVTALLPVGHRAAGDAYAATPKTRKPLDEVVERL